MKEEINLQKQKQLTRQTKIVLVVIFLITSTVSIFASAIYLFIQPGITSGIIFSLAILLFIVTPLILAIIYYNKVLNKKHTEEEKRIIELSTGETEQKSRLELIE